MIQRSFLYLKNCASYISFLFLCVQQTAESCYKLPLAWYQFNHSRCPVVSTTQCQSIDSTLRPDSFACHVTGKPQKPSVMNQQTIHKSFSQERLCPAYRLPRRENLQICTLNTLRKREQAQLCIREDNSFPFEKINVFKTDKFNNNKQ